MKNSPVQSGNYRLKKLLLVLFLCTTSSYAQENTAEVQNVGSIDDEVITDPGSGSELVRERYSNSETK